MKRNLAFSVCPHDCASACTLDIEISEENHVGRIYGSRQNPYTAGVICSKVARYEERVYHPDRLTKPLKRKTPKSPTANLSDFEVIEWEDALDLTANSFEEAQRKHGPETIWLYNYAGTMGLLQRDGIQRLRSTMGFSQQKNTICSWVMSVASKAGIGDRLSINPMEFEDSDLIIIWGSNPVYTQINLMKHINRARKLRGTKLVVIDPYCSATAKAADIHLSPMPGTDSALACAIMHVLFRDGWADRGYLEKYTDDPSGLEAHLKTRSPQWASRITGVSEEEIEELAADYGRSKRSIIRVGYGLSRSRNGAATLHSVFSIAAVSGAWQHQGGGIYAGTGGQFKIDTSLIIGPSSDARVLDMSQIGPILDGDMDVLNGGPPVTAMLIQSSNPAVVAPDSGRVRSGLLRDDLFTAVHEQFFTDTARLADVIFPATTFLEHNDLYTSYGHTYLQFGPKIIEPIGQCRSNHDLICALAKKLGADHLGFRLDDREILDRTLRNSQYPDLATLERNRLYDTGANFEEAHFLNGFPQDDQKFHFHAGWKSTNNTQTPLPDLPDFSDLMDKTNIDRPFRLITGPSRHFLNSTFSETETSKKLQKRPTAKINPNDADKLSMRNGDIIRVGNDKGSIAIHAEVSAETRTGTIVVESVWPNQAFIENMGINLLTSAEASQPSGGAPFHDTSVWIRAN